MARGKHRRPQPQQEFGYAVPLAPQIAYPAPPFPAPAPSVTLSVLGSKNATVARAQLTKPTKDWLGQEYQFEAAESAKREQGDVFDPKIGEMLAVARALQRLSRQLFSEANKQVKASVAEQERLEAERERKAEAVKQPVKRRTKEEWEAIQRAKLVPPGFMNELHR